MCLNLLLGSLNVADGLPVTQTDCERYTSLSFLLLMFIMFPIIKLRNNMVAGQNQPQTLNYEYGQNMTYMYIMYLIALLPVSKNYETLPAYRGH